MNVTIVGWFGEGNIGDDLILDSINEIVQSNLQPEEIFISSNHKVNEKYNWIYDHDFTIKSWVKFFIRGNPLNNIRAWITSEIVIFSIGGGLSDWNKIVMKRVLNKIRFFKMLNKKIYFVAIGAGPFVGNYSNDELYNILNTVEKILARDETSFDNLTKLGLKNVILTNDIVFEYQYLYRYKENIKARKQVKKNEKVIIIPAPIFYSNLWRNHESKFKQLMNSLNGVIEFLSKKYEVIVIPFQEEFDRKFLLDHLNQELEFSILSYQSYERVFDEIMDAKFTVPMRFHGLVLSAIFAVPMIPVVYDHKLYNLSKKLEVDNLCLSVGDGINWVDKVFSTDDFILSYNKLLSRYNEVKDNCKNYAAQACKNSRFLEGSK